MRGHIAYAVDERVLCWHQDLVYEAKVLEVKRESETPEYYVHYKGWKNTYVEGAFLFFKKKNLFSIEAPLRGARDESLSGDIFSSTSYFLQCKCP